MNLEKVFKIVLLFSLLIFSHWSFVLIIQLESDKKQYLEVMNNLSQTETQEKLRDRLGRDYSCTELLDWEHERLNYSYDANIKRCMDPLEILDYGKGRCQEFSILYVALCLTCGYRSRFIVDLYGDHTWAEITLNSSWTHVDPTEKRLNDPYMYERDWHKDIELVYAFEDGFCEDVTNSYRMNRRYQIMAIWIS